MRNFSYIFKEIFVNINVNNFANLLTLFYLDVRQIYVIAWISKMLANYVNVNNFPQCNIHYTLIA